MLTTFVALAVAALAILPGAVFTFSYEGRLGSYGVTLPDRIYRFLAASAVLHALATRLGTHAAEVGHLHCRPDRATSRPPDVGLRLWSGTARPLLVRDHSRGPGDRGGHTR